MTSNFAVVIGRFSVPQILSSPKRFGHPKANESLGQPFSHFSDDGNYAVVVGRDCKLEGLVQGVTQGR